MVRLRLPAALVLGFFLVGVVGCGPTLYQPKGKLTKGGAAFPTTKLGDKGMIQMTFFAESDTTLANGQAVTAEKDGAFTVTGSHGKGVPAGKYRVSIAVFDPYDSDPAQSKDLLDGAFLREKGPLVDVKDEKTEIEIKLDK